MSAAPLAVMSAVIGVSRSNAAPLDRRQHIVQSVFDVLTTPIGSRMMRRWYGSYLTALVDAPGNERGKIRALAAAADALARCEPRVRMRAGRVGAAADGRGRVTVVIEDTESNAVMEVSL